jgi:hypothetical protein
MEPAHRLFKNLLLIARPAAGKSEIIAHLRNTPLEERIRKYHIGKFEELDDFPMLWTWFEEDAILTELGHPRLHTDQNVNFLYPYLWDVLINRINLEYKKKLRDNPDYHGDHTAIIEFARGTSHGGFSRAFEHLSSEIAQDLAILYISVSYEESVRKNRARFNPDKPDSILEHGLPDDKMESLYREVDWEQIVSDHPEFILIQDNPVPYVIFENDDDLTTTGGELLSARLSESLQILFDRFNKRPDS